MRVFVHKMMMMRRCCCCCCKGISLDSLENIKKMPATLTLRPAGATATPYRWSHYDGNARARPPLLFLLLPVICRPDPKLLVFFFFFSSFFLRIQRKPPYHTMPLPPLLPPHLASLVSWHNRHYVYGYYHYCGSNCLPRSFAITRLEKKERMKKKLGRRKNEQKQQQQKKERGCSPPQSLWCAVMSVSFANPPPLGQVTTQRNERRSRWIEREREANIFVSIFKS